MNVDDKNVGSFDNPVHPQELNRGNHEACQFNSKQTMSDSIMMKMIEQSFLPPSDTYRFLIQGGIIFDLTKNLENPEHN